jgi:hypothetical protein
MCFLGQQMVFEEAEQTFMHLLGTKVNAKQIERVCHYYGQQAEDDLQQSISRSGTISNVDTKSCYAMLDGGMIFTREEKWKEMKVARFFDKQNHVTISKDRNYIGHSIYVAHLGNHLDFLKKAEHYLDRKGNVIFIADGARWIWRWVEAMYPESTQILDFYHAKQHLCQYADTAIRDKARKQKWLNDQTFLLLNDGIEIVIENIKEIKRGSGNARSEKKKILEYYSENKERMKYKTCKEQGLMIGSGPIEAAHRNVIQQRMKLSGQRWTKKGAQQMANLRVLNKSNQWGKVNDFIEMAA